jgi:hypothetical protein
MNEDDVSMSGYPWVYPRYRPRYDDYKGILVEPDDDDLEDDYSEESFA